VLLPNVHSGPLVAHFIWLTRILLIYCLLTQLVETIYIRRFAQGLQNPGPRILIGPLRNREAVMKAFISACIAAIAIAVIGAFVLGGIQEPADHAFSTSAVRLGQ